MDVLETGFAPDILDTPELETPPAVPDAHEGEIMSVTEQTFDSGSTAIVVTLGSHNAAFQQEYKIFPPVEFVSNYQEVVESNGAALSDEVPEGKKQSPKQRYAATIANSTKDAEVQRLRQIATEALGVEGVAARLSGMQKPTDFSQFVTTLNQLLSGVPVVFTRKPDANAEPQYKNRLNVNRIYGRSIQSKPKALKNFTKAWEQ